MQGVPIFGAPQARESFTTLFTYLARTRPWVSEALCGETDEKGDLVHDPDLWYPKKGGSVRKAKAICSGCPVRVDCLEYAEQRREDSGVWGGLSSTERYARRKAKERSGHGPDS